MSANSLDNGAECTLKKIADDIKLGGVAHTAEACAAIWSEFNSLEKLANKNLMKFSKWNCQVLPLGRNNPLHQYGLEPEWLESTLAE